MLQRRFEWDSKKAAGNFAKHLVDFAYAARAFEDEFHVIAEDKRREYGEKRFTLLAEIERRIYVVIYTERGDVIRLISARKANYREEKKYYAICT
jgi:uncharacterized protein